jgi:hypothetical protein
LPSHSDGSFSSFRRGPQTAVDVVALVDGLHAGDDLVHFLGHAVHGLLRGEGAGVHVADLLPPQLRELRIVRHKGLSVVTNKLNVALILSHKPDFQVIVAGGLVRARHRGIIGEPTIDLIRQFKVDIAIIGISGIDADGALLDFDYREVRVAQTIMENSRQVFLAVDHT